MNCNRHETVSSRREFLMRYAYGFGGIALGHLSAASNGLSPKPPHYPAKAKHVILIFMQGGPSHVDTFDPKPLLNRLDGQPVPDSIARHIPNIVRTPRTGLLGTRFRFARHGHSGLPVSELFPHIARHADDLC